MSSTVYLFIKIKTGNTNSSDLICEIKKIRRSNLFEKLKKKARTLGKSTVGYNF